MSDVIDGISSFFSGIFDSIIRNITGFAILFIIVGIAYLYFTKKKTINLGRVMFDKFWDVTAETMGFPNEKELCLCTYPSEYSTEDLKSNINSLNYEPIGGVTGVNVMGKGIDPALLKSIAKNPEDKNIDKMRLEYEDKVKSGEFWFVFAVKTKIGGKFLFPEVKKTLLLVNPDQVISVSRWDTRIFVRGFGVHPIGEYDVLVDENIITTRRQARIDICAWIEEEGLLSEWGRLGEIVEKAMQGDASWRKDLSRDNSMIAHKQTGIEVET